MSRLYFLEFFITELNLDCQILRDAGETDFVIRINFIDFPTFEITQRNVSVAKVNQSLDKSHFNFKAGQACHFTSNPKKLVDKILKHPLSIKIFRKGDSFPLCLAELPLSGCLCDQVNFSSGKLNIPKPYVFGGKIFLVDVGGNHAGNVNINLRITCNGKYIATSYILEKGCFIFKNDAQGAEFKVEKLQENKEIKEKEKTDEFLSRLEDTGQGFEWENYTRDVCGIFPSAERLSLGKPPRKEPRLPLQEVRLPIESIEIKKESNKNKKSIKNKNKKNKNKKN